MIIIQRASEQTEFPIQASRPVTSGGAKVDMRAKTSIAKTNIFVKSVGFTLISKETYSQLNFS